MALQPKDRYRPGSSAPIAARSWFPVVPSDTVDLPDFYVGLSCEESGVAVLIDSDGNQFNLTMAAGFVYPFAPLRIMATGTTAAGIRGLL